MFTKSVLSFLALTLAAPALAAPATPTELALVKQQFVQALLTPDVVPTFDPTALLNVSFPATGAITTGQVVSKDDAGAQPTITVVGTDADFATGGNLNSASKYTLIMIDGDYAGAAHPNGVNTHYLQNDFTFGQNTDDVLSLTATTAPVIKYAGPGPAANSGAHRYTILLFQQPTSFTAPSTPAAGSSVTLIDFPTYVKNANLGNPLAGIYFTVEVGTAPTVSPSPTSAVDTATLSVAASSSSGAASHSGSAASATSTTTKSNGAVAKGASGVFVGVVALMFGAALA